MRIFEDYLKPVEVVLKEETPTSVDYLALELYKKKKTLSPMMYKKLHKIMMTGDEEKCQQALDKLNSITETTTETPEKILRSHGFKIKLVAPTKFGTQVDFAKKYEEEDIKKVLKGYTLKFDGKSVFIID